MLVLLLLLISVAQPSRALEKWKKQWCSSSLKRQMKTTSKEAMTLFENSLQRIEIDARDLANSNKIKNDN